MFIRRGPQADAFFRAVSPVAPMPITESQLTITPVPSQASIGKTRQPRTDIKAEQVIVGQKLGLNVEGLVNIATAGVFAGFAAAPVLTRPSSPFTGIRGDIKVGVEALTQKGITQSITELQFTRRSPTLGGFVGKRAQTTVRTVSPGEGLRVTTKVGQREFTFDQPLLVQVFSLIYPHPL